VRSYGAEQGQGPLREAIAAKLYPGMRTADEVFVSDGSKCDISRIQLMFGANASIAVQVRGRLSLPTPVAELS
jgi:LL-diaminopimelate aminotransferase